MTEQEVFINTNKEIDKCVVLMGKMLTYKLLKEFAEHTRISNFILVRLDSCDSRMEGVSGKLKKDLGYIPECITECDASDLTLPSGDWAIWGYKLAPEELIPFAQYRPKWLLASIKEDYMSSFTIWESYKKYTSRIIITTVRKEQDDQVLDWEKREDNNIELSIVLPMYNVAKYLPQCIEGLTAWKADYIEYLFVNDGSPDNSRDVILEYAEKDPRIKLLDKENGGCASARQYGMEKANGRYIGFVDPDDFVDESMYRKLLRAAMVGSYEISGCGYIEYYENTGGLGRVYEDLNAPYCYGTGDKEMIRNLINSNRVAIWRRIYKKEMIEKAGIHFYTDLRRFDDLPFQVEVFAAASSVITIQEPLYYYRLARPGQDVSADDERLYVHFDIFNYLNKSIAGLKDQALTDRLQICKLQTHIYALSKIRTEFKEEYIKRAKADLDSTGDKERTLLLIERKQIKDNRDELYKAIESLDVEKFNHYIAERN